ncbi:hypothetical protein [Autumnicola musiva]|uniref:Lipoprotein n=1 Tax=Autumnicola musiva TaxID=3075589 RepID=A0ABU3D507_9FLAO|nr:hypothetical protein [Zunongwangia sp. F117]MDT0676491.1 hypothetical protein [Zunongwangia sp. F117]
MKKIIFILGIALAIQFSSCSKNDDQVQSSNLVNEVQFIVKDEEGNNLIPNKYNSETIKLFSEINGEFEEIFDSNLDYPRNFKIAEKDGENILSIWPFINEEEDVSRTLIQWEEGDVDTLETSYIKTDDATILKEVWFNGDLILSNEENDQYIYELSKD